MYPDTEAATAENNANPRPREATSGGATATTSVESDPKPTDSAAARDLSLNRLSDAVEHGLRARGVGTTERADFRIHEDLTRYYDVIARSLETVDLTEGEASFIVDMLNGSLLMGSDYRFLRIEVEDAIDLAGLDEKWEVDGNRFITKIAELRPAQLLAIVDAAERFWQLSGSGDRRSTPELLQEAGLV